jgi:hypothetical protein
MKLAGTKRSGAFTPPAIRALHRGCCPPISQDASVSSMIFSSSDVLFSSTIVDDA